MSVSATQRGASIPHIPRVLWLLLTALSVVVPVLLLMAAPSSAAALEPRFSVSGGRSWVHSARVTAGDSGFSPFFTPGVVVWDGGSIMGSLGSRPGWEYSTKTLALLDKVCASFVSSTPGADIEQMIREAPTEVDSRHSAHADLNVCVVQGGASDLKGASSSPSEVLSSVRRYCEERRSAGFAVVVLTLLPRTDIPGFEERRRSFNRLLRSSWSDFSDGLADIAADARIGDYGDNEDERYYRRDHKHPNARGRLVMAAVTAPILSSLAWRSASVEVRLRNQDDDWSDWRPWSPHLAWRLSPGDGAKTVECDYRADGQEVVSTSDDVSLDSVAPSTQAPVAARVESGDTARLRYMVRDPLPTSGRAVGRIVIRDKLGKAVAVIEPLRCATNSLQTARFACSLDKGTYRYSVYARDIAGNHQTEVGWNTLKVR